MRARDKAAADLAAQRRAFAADQAALAERERACREMEMLQAARKRLLDQRHAVLNACTPADTPAQQARLRDLEAMLNRTRAELDAANAALAQRDQQIEDLLNRIPATAPSNETTAAQPVEVDSSDAISHPSLQDQVAFLREREAFIEQSENTLFEKAQHLQEWESRLQQIEHDLDHRDSAQPSAEK
jgi:chromosome segregation ATPase